MGSTIAFPILIRGVLMMNTGLEIQYLYYYVVFLSGCGLSEIRLLSLKNIEPLSGSISLNMLLPSVVFAAARFSN